jgi:hypothetical protein
MRIRLVSAFLAAGALQPAAGKVTFSENVAPIIYGNCVTCHRPGEAAPFALLSYEDVKKRGSLIAAVTKSRYMPPWHAAQGYGEFLDERRLTDAQIETIGEWVKQGMPEGDRARMPKVPQFTEGWHLGKPDLVLEMPAAFEVPASGPDIYRNIVIPSGVTEDKWVRAIEFRPSARRAVHHVILSYVRGGSLAAQDGKDGKPGFSGLAGLAVGGGPGTQPSGPLGGFAVGSTPAFMPGGIALPLGKGSDIVAQLHFHPTGKVETERSTIGVYFADTAPERRIFNVGQPGLFGLLSGLDIPPGEKNYTIKGTMKIPVDMRAYSVAAHAHYLGKEMKATATLPDGAVKPLLWIQDWDFNWQDRYTYKEPVLLPKGTQLDVTITYDNSAENPHNPSSPPKRVRWGLESFDEMGGVQFVMVTARKEDELVMQGIGAAVVRSIGNQLQQDGTVQRIIQQQQDRAKEAAGK